MVTLSYQNIKELIENIFTEKILLHISDNSLKNMENQKCRQMVCLDLSTAFDTVSYKILQDIFKNYFEISEQTLS